MSHNAPEFIGCNDCYKEDQEYCDHCRKMLYFYCPDCGNKENMIRLDEERCKQCESEMYDKLQAKYENLRKQFNELHTAHSKLVHSLILN